MISNMKIFSVVQKFKICNLVLKITGDDKLNNYKAEKTKEKCLIMTFYMCFDWRVLNWCLVFQLSNKYFYCYFLNSFRFSLLRNLQTNWQVLSALYSQCFRQLKFCLILLFAKLRFGQELFRVLKTFEYLVGINNCITSLRKSPHYNIIIINKRENVSK